jgi:hypothetical protein
MKNLDEAKAWIESNGYFCRKVQWDPGSSLFIQKEEGYFLIRLKVFPPAILNSPDNVQTDD